MQGPFPSTHPAASLHHPSNRQCTCVRACPACHTHPAAQTCRLSWAGSNKAGAQAPGTPISTYLLRIGLRGGTPVRLPAREAGAWWLKDPRRLPVMANEAGLECLLQFSSGYSSIRTWGSGGSSRLISGPHLGPCALPMRVRGRNRANEGPTPQRILSHISRLLHRDMEVAIGPAKNF